MKKLLMMTTIAATLAAFAQEVPVPAPVAPGLAAAPLAETATGGLCKTYNGEFHSDVGEFETSLSKAIAIDQGYDAAATKFNGEAIAKHSYNAVSWEGFLKSPEAGAFTFTISPSERPYMAPGAYVIKINGKEFKGNTQQTVTTELRKGLNSIFIATAIVESHPITIDYRYNASTKPSVPLMPKNIKHIVGDDDKQVVFE